MPITTRVLGMARRIYTYDPGALGNLWNPECNTRRKSYRAALCGDCSILFFLIARD